MDRRPRQGHPRARAQERRRRLERPMPHQDRLVRQGRPRPPARQQPTIQEMLWVEQALKHQLEATLLPRVQLPIRKALPVPALERPPQITRKARRAQ